MRMILPEVHDGELRKIEIPGDGMLILTFETIDKSITSLILEDVRDFRCDGVLAGNIISKIVRIVEPTLDDLARATCRESDPRHCKPPSERERRLLEGTLRAVTQGELVFLRMESSYGCTMDALCSGYAIR